MQVSDIVGLLVTLACMAAFLLFVSIFAGCEPTGTECAVDQVDGGIVVLDCGNGATPAESSTVTLGGV